MDSSLSFLVPQKTYRQSIKTIDDFVTPYIDAALQLSEEELKSKGEVGYTFLHALAGFTKDRKLLRDQLVGILLAGRVCCFFPLYTEDNMGLHGLTVRFGI